MEKPIGLFRAIKQEWLCKTADLVVQGHCEEAIKSELDEYLSFEIESAINRGKTRTLLMNIWVKPESTSRLVHKNAIEAYKHEESNKIALSWALFILAHPIFANVCALVGKIATVQNTFTTAWIKEKICELHGERPTLLRSVAGILETMRFLGAIEKKRIGVYEIKKHKIIDVNTISVLLLSLLAQNRQAYYEVSDIANNPMFFPFEFTVTLDWLHRSQLFNLNNFGGKMVLSGTG